MKLKCCRMNAKVGSICYSVDFQAVAISHPKSSIYVSSNIASMLHASLPEYLILWSVTHLASANLEYRKYRYYNSVVLLYSRYVVLSFTSL